MSLIESLPPGRRVEILAVRFPEYSGLIGRFGTIKKYVSSRNVYRIELDGDGKIWEALPGNICPITEV